MMVSQGLNVLFMPGGPKFLFEVALSKLLQVTGPWAKGLRVLEAADVTADHLYYIRKWPPSIILLYSTLCHFLLLYVTLYAPN